MSGVGVKAGSETVVGGEPVAGTGAVVDSEPQVDSERENSTRRQQNVTVDFMIARTSMRKSAKVAIITNSIDKKNEMELPKVFLNPIEHGPSNDSLFPSRTARKGPRIMRFWAPVFLWPGSVCL